MTHDESIRVHIELLPDPLDILFLRSMLDNPHRPLEIGQGDLAVRVGLNDIETRSNLLVVFFELDVDLLDHAPDTLRNGDAGRVGVIGSPI